MCLVHNLSADIVLLFVYESVSLYLSLTLSLIINLFLLVWVPLGTRLLLGGNHYVQQTMYAHLSTTEEDEKFFHAIR